MRNHKHWLLLSVCVMVFDQISKYWAEHILQNKVIAVTSWFDFSLVHNMGAAFGFLSKAGGWQHVFFIALALLVCVALVVVVFRLQAHERHLAVAYCLVIGGAVGNVVDRLVYSYVIDFIHLFYKQWHYPHFNIADVAICLGAFLLISEALGKPFLDKQRK